MTTLRCLRRMRSPRSKVMQPLATLRYRRRMRTSSANGTGGPANGTMLLAQPLPAGAQIGRAPRLSQLTALRRHPRRKVRSTMTTRRCQRRMQSPRSKVMQPLATLRYRQRMRTIHAYGTLGPDYGTVLLAQLLPARAQFEWAPRLSLPVVPVQQSLLKVGTTMATWLCLRRRRYPSLKGSQPMATPRCRRRMRTKPANGTVGPANGTVPLAQPPPAKAQIG